MTIRLICLLCVCTAYLGWTSPILAYEGENEDAQEVEPTPEQSKSDQPSTATQKPRGKVTPLQQLRMLERLEKAVLKEMDLDEEHRDAVAVLFEVHFDQVREAAEAYRGKRRASKEAMRKLVAELREAREGDDVDRLAEIRQELAKLRREGRHIADMNQDFFKNVKAVLEEEDIEKFDSLVKRFMTTANGNAAISIRDIQNVLAGLDLTDDQKEAMKPLLVGAKADMDEFGKDPDKIAVIQSGLEKALIKELNEEQVANFQSKLADLRKRAQAKGEHERSRDDRSHGVSDDSDDDNRDYEDEPAEDAEEAFPEEG